MEDKGVLFWSPELDELWQHLHIVFLQYIYLDTTFHLRSFTVIKQDEEE